MKLKGTLLFLAFHGKYVSDLSLKSFSKIIQDQGCHNDSLRVKEDLADMAGCGMMKVKIL